MHSFVSVSMLEVLCSDFIPVPRLHILYAPPGPFHSSCDASIDTCHDGKITSLLQRPTAYSLQAPHFALVQRHEP